MGPVKDRNGKYLIEAEDIKKWQEYTEELYKKGLNDGDNQQSVVTHLEPDIPECEVKWALGPQTKIVEVIEFQLNYLKILQDASAKSAALSMSANLENSAYDYRTRKGQLSL